jgi:hypothetical protein
MKRLLKNHGMFLFFALILISSCKKDEKLSIIRDKISGLVQKGPFINGTSISLYELNSKFEQTGKNFQAQINSNSGGFEINNIGLASNFAELSADGYYYDEVAGRISSGQLNLLALADISLKSSVNVNVLTHLEKERVEYLIKQGNSFVEAKRQAQAEILSVFGFKLEGMSESELLNISEDTEGNAILLAISIILQGKRNTGDLSELLAKISDDLSADGILSNSTITELASSTKTLDQAAIRNFLTKRYADLAINTTIPNFEKYINSFLSNNPTISITTSNASNISAYSIQTGGNIINDGIQQVISRGVCWSIYPNPTISDNKTTDGEGDGTFTSNLTNLNSNTLYYVRSYATTANGTFYGNQISFRTISSLHRPGTMILRKKHWPTKGLLQDCAQQKEDK